MAVLKPVRVDTMSAAAELEQAAEEQGLRPITEEDIRKAIETCPGEISR